MATNMNNPEKLATLGTQDEDNQTQHSTLCVGHHHTQDEDQRSKNTTQYVIDTGPLFVNKHK